MATATAPKRRTSNVQRAELEALLRRISKRSYPTSARTERQFITTQIRTLLGEKV